MDLTLRQISDVNKSRASHWHPGFPDDDTWTGSDWSNAMAGEAGEACNVVKKLRRAECGLVGKLDPPPDELVAKLAHEIADVYLYLDLLAQKYGIDLQEAIVEKFNMVSELQDFPERLGAYGGLKLLEGSLDGESFTWETVPVGHYVPGSGEILRKAPHASGFHVTFQRKVPFEERWTRYWHAKDSVPIALTSTGLMY